MTSSQEANLMTKNARFWSQVRPKLGTQNRPKSFQDPDKGSKIDVEDESQKGIGKDVLNWYARNPDKPRRSICMATWVGERVGGAPPRSVESAMGIAGKLPVQCQCTLQRDDVTMMLKCN